MASITRRISTWALGGRSTEVSTMGKDKPIDRESMDCDCSDSHCITWPEPGRQAPRHHSDKYWVQFFKSRPAQSTEAEEGLGESPQKLHKVLSSTFLSLSNTVRSTASYLHTEDAQEKDNASRPRIGTPRNRRHRSSVMSSVRNRISPFTSRAREARDACLSSPTAVVSAADIEPPRLDVEIPSWFLRDENPRSPTPVNRLTQMPSRESHAEFQPLSQDLEDPYVDKIPSSKPSIISVDYKGFPDQRLKCISDPQSHSSGDGSKAERPDWEETFPPLPVVRGSAEDHLERLKTALPYCPAPPSGLDMSASSPPGKVILPSSTPELAPNQCTADFEQDRNGPTPFPTDGFRLETETPGSELLSDAHKADVYYSPKSPDPPSMGSLEAWALLRARRYERYLATTRGEHDMPPTAAEADEELWSDTAWCRNSPVRAIRDDKADQELRLPASAEGTWALPRENLGCLRPGRGLADMRRLELKQKGEKHEGKKYDCAPRLKKTIGSYENLLNELPAGIEQGAANLSPMGCKNVNTGDLHYAVEAIERRAGDKLFAQEPRPTQLNRPTDASGLCADVDLFDVKVPNCPLSDTTDEDCAVTTLSPSCSAPPPFPNLHVRSGHAYPSSQIVDTLRAQDGTEIPLAGPNSMGIHSSPSPSANDRENKIAVLLQLRTEMIGNELPETVHRIHQRNHSLRDPFSPELVTADASRNPEFYEADDLVQSYMQGSPPGEPSSPASGLGSPDLEWESWESRVILKTLHKPEFGIKRFESPEVKPTAYCGYEPDNELISFFNQGSPTSTGWDTPVNSLRSSAQKTVSFAEDIEFINHDGPSDLSPPSPGCERSAKRLSGAETAKMVQKELEAKIEKACNRLIDKIKSEERKANAPEERNT